MTTEIEFKFSAQEKALAALPVFLAQHTIIAQDTFTLSNDYYDTPNQDLSQKRTGFRVRGRNQQFEMTLKAGGNSVGGLHQRQEFNVSLTDSEPNLALLPEEAQVLLGDIGALQTQLVKRFSTNFERQRWLIRFQKSEIELVCDQGAVVAGARSVPICEIELELLSGSVTDLFDFAHLFAKLDGLRLSSESKAARGYQLLADESVASAPPSRVIFVAPKKCTVEQGFQSSMHFALDFWQRQELSYLQEDNRRCLEAVVALIRELFSIFGGILPRKATTQLREGLDRITELLQTENQVEKSAEDRLYSSVYLQVKMQFLEWVYHQKWQAFCDAKNQKKWDGSFKRFADIMLGRLGATLKSLFPTALTTILYQDKLIKLQQTVAGLYLMSGAYTDVAMPYIQAWENLQQAIEKPLSVDRLNSLRQHALQVPAFWFNDEI